MFENCAIEIPPNTVAIWKVFKFCAEVAIRICQNRFAQTTRKSWLTCSKNMKIFVGIFNVVFFHVFDYFQHFDG